MEDNTLLGIIPHLSKGWRITFDVFASKYEWKSPGSSVIYMVEGNHNGSERTVALISFTKLNVNHDSATGLHIQMTSLEEGTKNFIISTEVPELETWTTIEFSQSLVDGSYNLNLMYNGIGVMCTTGLRPKPYTYDYVQVWAGGQEGNLIRCQMIPVIIKGNTSPAVE